MSRSLPLFLVLPLLAASFIAPAAAQQSMPCGERDDILGHLAGKFQEEPVAMGLATNGSVVEVLASSAGDSFTIVYTTANGLTCMMAAGSNWETVKRQLADIET